MRWVTHLVPVVDSRSLRLIESVTVGDLDTMKLVDVAREMDTSTADGVVLLSGDRVGAGLG